MIALQLPTIHKTRSVTLSEQDVIAAIRAGSERDFEAVFRQYYAPLCGYARQLLADSDDAEEEVQAMFLALWEKRIGLIITISLQSYLFRAVHNRCLNRLKHLSVRNEHREYTRYVGEGTVESPAQTLMGNELADRLHAAIQKLPEQCRRVFMLSRFEELRYNEIAEQLGISVKTVENQIGKALRILRIELGDYLPMALVLYHLKWILESGLWLGASNPILLSFLLDPVYLSSLSFA